MKAFKNPLLLLEIFLIVTAMCYAMQSLFDEVIVTGITAGITTTMLLSISASRKKRNEAQ